MSENSNARRLRLIEKQKKVGRKLSRKSKKRSGKMFNYFLIIESLVTNDLPKENGVYELSTGVWERK